MRYLALLFILFAFFAATFSCSNEAPPLSASITDRDSAAVMTTYGCSKLISDSGVMRYKIIAEEWRVFDRTTPQRQEFPKGIYLERFDENYKVNLFITADTAYWYDQNLWELHGHVLLNNLTDQTTFSTSLLYWDMGKHEFYSDAFMRITTATQQLEGDHFRSNESMTRYEVKRSKGYTPVPKEEEPTALEVQGNSNP